MALNPLNAFRVLLPLVVVIALADAALLWWLISTHGWNESSALLFTRYSARVSCLFFLPVFVASAAHSLLHTSFTARLLLRRRQWGLGFAFAHTLHMGGIVAHYQVRGDWFSAEDIPALIIYLFIALMVVTSNAQAVRKLGSAWKWLHKIGIYSIFIGFSTTYVGRLSSYQVSISADEPAHEWFMVYLFLSILVLGALGLRILAFWHFRARQ